jgi:hypothetical protein
MNDTRIFSSHITTVAHWQRAQPTDRTTRGAHLEGGGYRMYLAARGYKPTDAPNATSVETHAGSVSFYPYILYPLYPLQVLTSGTTPHSRQSVTLPAAAQKARLLEEIALLLQALPSYAIAQTFGAQKEWNRLSEKFSM